MRRALLCAAILLPLAAAAVVLAPAHSAPADAAWQRTVGGLGHGAAVDPAVCRPAFDLRHDPACRWRHDPGPGGDLFCPCHK